MGSGDLCKMADHRGGAIEENQVQPVKSQANSGADRYLNGQCVLSISSGSILSPGFDLEMCRSRLEMNGFQIPESDLEVPLKTALDVPSVKRYITFNSSLFHFLMAPVLYVVLWCAVFSSLHTYITITDYWVLCLCVSLVAIFLTTAIIFILHRSNKKNKLKKRMSHLVLVSEVSQIKTETEEGDVEQGTDEHRPLLQEEPERNTSSDQKGAHQLTTSLSLVPDTVLSAQVKAQQLLMTYSALYIKLLVSEHLSGPSHYRMRLKRNHCTTASLCLCQFIRSEILR
ncbi:transmembrane protein 268 isoform X4 [Boleophthalmus pectinirostris]|uniref:transmembrane protein 268 isoform X4 n=1 Tax=Boleophthalmus pectinirostris TaxID=150288 RepID=UPI0024309208|nr:transmembrane protein 268 isoform X4 [Boleophthalmus pectinirostris]